MKSTDRKWTVMVFLSGDNDLAEEMLLSIKDMKQSPVGPDKPVTVIALYQPAFGLPTQLYVVNRNGCEICSYDSLLREAELFEPGNGLNMQDPATLRVFIERCVNEFPARSYMVVLSGHSNDDLFQNLGQAKEALTLGGCFPQGGKIDVLGIDSCLSSTVEVFYQLRKAADYFVAAQGQQLTIGWPYRNLLDMLAAEPEVEPRELSAALVQHYILYYHDFALSGHSMDLSACDASRAQGLCRAVKDLAGELNAAIDDQQLRDQILLSHWEAQTYNSDQYVDLFDFCRVLRERCGGSGLHAGCSAIVEACARVETELARAVLRSCYTGPAFQYSYGLSIYFPWSHVIRKYDRLAFGKDSGWTDFLEAFVGKTRRKPRGKPVQDSSRRLLESAYERRKQIMLERDWWSGMNHRDTPPYRKGNPFFAITMNPPQTWFPCSCFEQEQTSELEG